MSQATMTRQQWTMCVRFIIAFLLTTVMAVMSACSIPFLSHKDSSPKTPAPVASAGMVDFFIPTSTLEVDPHRPINTWSSFHKAIYAALINHNFDKNNISFTSFSSLSSQTSAIETTISKHQSESATTQRTIVVAPAIAQTATSSTIISRYGDMVAQNVNTSETSSDSATKDKSEKDITAMANTLKKAKSAGIHVVLMSHKIEGFTPDFFVSTADASSIARIQTVNLVKKLQINHATAAHPIAVELLLSVDAGGDFNREAFNTAWTILQPYFASGAVYSPSGLLTGQSTKDDWRNITIVQDNSEGVLDALTHRLTNSEGQLMRIDGILAFNDYTALNVISSLETLGYTGTSNQINPSISLEGLVNTFVGRTDVNKLKVPTPRTQITPQQQQQADEQNSSNDSSNSVNSDTDKTTHSTQEALTWPIITGYGIYLDSIVSIVNGKLWMSAMEDRLAYARDIAHLCYGLNTSQNEAMIHTAVTALIKGTVHELPLAVSADNIKQTLIDPGYISPADAGL